MQKAQNGSDLRTLVAAMREAQKTYFKDRSRENLIASKQAEAAVDAALAEPEWRSVENDPPPHGKDVLLYSPPCVGLPSGWMDVLPYSQGQPGARSYHSHATHWRSLPPAPVTKDESDG